jgi:hypothetical protein
MTPSAFGQDYVTRGSKDHPSGGGVRVMVRGDRGDRGDRGHGDRSGVALCGVVIERARRRAISAAISALAPSKDTAAAWEGGAPKRRRARTWRGVARPRRAARGQQVEHAPRLRERDPGRGLEAGPLHRGDLVGGGGAPVIGRPRVVALQLGGEEIAHVLTDPAGHRFRLPLLGGGARGVDRVHDVGAVPAVEAGRYQLRDLVGQSWGDDVGGGGQAVASRRADDIDHETVELPRRGSRAAPDHLGVQGP